MALIKFVANWSKSWAHPKGYLLLKPKETYHKNMAIALNKLDEIQAKKEELKDIDVTIEIHYKKRTLDQNNLLWALYSIESNEINAGMKGTNSQMCSSQELYENDLVAYAPRIKMQVKNDYYDVIRSEYRVEDAKDYNNDTKVITCILTTSKFNTKQMAEWIDRIFNRMAQNGVTVTNPAEIHDYWTKWKMMLNDEKIVLHDDILTEDQYKSLNPICEACSKFIGDGTGQISHIKTRGSGGADRASNYLHLCNACHIGTQHAKGFEYFLKLYPHLSYKILTALKREYPTTEDKTTIEDVKNVFDGEEATK
jgi:hypothetical protein